MVRIAVDLNASVSSVHSLRTQAVSLHRLGSLRDLCMYKLRLAPGMPLTVFSDSDETHDLQVEAVAQWYEEQESADGGQWVAEFEPGALLEVPGATRLPLAVLFPCSGCASNLALQIRTHGLQLGDVCETCEEPIQAPLQAPDLHGQSKRVSGTLRQR